MKQELKNQLDRERLRNNPSEFFGTNEFGDNSGSSTIENNNNADNAVKNKETNERTQDRYIDLLIIHKYKIMIVIKKIQKQKKKVMR